MNNGLSISRRGKNRSFFLEPVAEFIGIDQIPVMGDGNAPAAIVNHDRLAVFQVIATGR